MALTALALHAIPALPGQWRTLTLTDGTTVRAQLVGDEVVHYFQDAQGNIYTMVGSDTFALTTLDALEAQAAPRRQLRSRRMNRLDNVKATGTPIKGHLLVQPDEPIVGNKKGIVLMVSFPDKAFSKSKQFYENMINQEEFAEEGFRGSVADYFRAQSFGKLNVDFDVVGPIQMPHPLAYYGERSSTDIERIHEMVSYACHAADSQYGIDFSQYDWNGDGKVNQVFLYYAGYGYATGYEPNTIWPHASYLDQASDGGTDDSFVLDGVKIDTYACSNEIFGNATYQWQPLMGIGTMCHEFSHCLGFPDLYNTDWQSAYTMGYWDVMSRGSYTGWPTMVPDSIDTASETPRGYRPSGYTAYERMAAGWITPTELGSEDVEGALLPALSQTGEAYIIRNESQPNEYMLLENRQPAGWDDALYGRGMLITHINYDEVAWANNKVNTITRSNYTIVAADGAADYDSEAQDPFPATLSTGAVVDSISASSHSVKWFNRQTDRTYAFPHTIKNIVQRGDGNISFDFLANTNSRTRHPLYSEATDPLLMGDDLLFWESFNACTGEGGNDNKWTGLTVGTGALRADNDGWANSYNSKGATQRKYFNGAYNCAKIGSQMSYMQAMTPVVACSEAVRLSFRAAPWGATDSTSIRVLAIRETTDAQTGALTRDTLYNQLAMKRLAIEQWTQLVLPMKVAEGNVRFVVKANCRFFLDEVVVRRISPDDVTNGIATPAMSMAAKSNNGIYYNLQGMPMGTNPARLPKGIYIIGGRKVAL